MNVGPWKGWRIDVAGATVVVALAAVFYLAGLGPLLARREAVMARQERLGSQRARAGELERRLATAREHLEATRRELDRCAVHLEPTSAVNRRLAKLSDLASAAGLKVDQLKPGRAEQAVHYETVPIHIAGKGTYRECVAFLHCLRKVFPDTGVASLDLAGAPATASVFQFGLKWHAATGLARAGE